MSRSRSRATPTAERSGSELFIVLTDDVALSLTTDGGRARSVGSRMYVSGRPSWGEGRGRELVEPRASVCLLRKVLAATAVCRLPRALSLSRKPGPWASRKPHTGVPGARAGCASPGGYEHACQEVFMLCALI